MAHACVSIMLNVARASSFVLNTTAGLPAALSLLGVYPLLSRLDNLPVVKCRKHAIPFHALDELPRRLAGGRQVHGISGPGSHPRVSRVRQFDAQRQ